MRKTRDLIIITLIYILSFAIGLIPTFFIENVILRFFVFDSLATIVTFIFSCILKNSSVYDAYWSLTPMVMSIWLFIIRGAFSPLQIAFLLVFNIWSIRLTLNWVNVFTDFSYEDWRYSKFRDETPKLLWPIVNFFGIHYMPTFLVFLGMLPLFAIADGHIGLWSIPGMVIILIGVLLELLADTEMHRFLRSKGIKGVCCETGLWRYSRHPNYLGEITVWLGVFLSMLPYALNLWYYGVGFVGMVILFNVVSIPLMEKRQLKRRPSYAEYRRTTSRLLLLPKRK